MIYEGINYNSNEIDQEAQVQAQGSGYFTHIKTDLTTTTTDYNQAEVRMQSASSKGDFHWSQDLSGTTSNFNYNGQEYKLGGLIAFEQEPVPTSTPTPPSMVAADEETVVEPSPSVAPTPELVSEEVTSVSTPVFVPNLPAELMNPQESVCEYVVTGAHIEKAQDELIAADESTVSERIEPDEVIYKQPSNCINPSSYASIVVDATDKGGLVHATGTEFGVVIFPETIEDAYSKKQVCVTIDACNMKILVSPNPENRDSNLTGRQIVALYYRVLQGVPRPDGSINYKWELEELINYVYSDAKMFKLMPQATATPTATATSEPQVIPTCVPVLPTPTFNPIAPTFTPPTPTPIGYPVSLNPVGNGSNFTGAPHIGCFTPQR